MKKRILFLSVISCLLIGCGVSNDNSQTTSDSISENEVPSISNSEISLENSETSNSIESLPPSSIDDSSSNVILVESIKSREEVNIIIGESINLNAEALPSNADDKELIFEVADSNIAEVNDGVVTGLLEGNTTITIIARSNPSVTKVVPVNVSEYAQDDDRTFIIDLNAADFRRAFGDKTYLTSNYDFTVRNVAGGRTAEFTGIAQCFGVYQKYYAKGSGFYNLNCMQFRKGNTAIKSIDYINCVIRKVVINWYASYSSEATKYFPVVKINEVNGNMVEVPCDQKTTLTGVETDELYTNDSGTYKIYGYQTTYTLNKTWANISFGAGDAVQYVQSIILY